MALVVEDGTGVEDAESYETVANCDTYFTSQRGNPVAYQDSGDWLHAGTTTAIKEACLRWATEIIDALWSFEGTKLNEGEDYLKWPREGAYDDEGIEIAGDIVPRRVRRAVCEFARTLLLDPDRLDDQELGLKSGQAGPVSGVFDKYDRPGKLPSIVKRLLSLSSSASGARETSRA